MRSWLVALVATCALGAVPAYALHDPSAPAPSSVAPRCGSGYKSAVLPWGRQCLRRGMFCSIRADRHYPRYGFHCHTGRLA